MKRIVHNGENVCFGWIESSIFWVVPTLLADVLFLCIYMEEEHKTRRIYGTTGLMIQGS